MKKFGFLIFAGALIIGVIFSTIFSIGRVSDKIFNVSVNVGSAKGSGQMATERRELRDFHAVDVGGVFQVEIIAQKDFSVEIEADDNLLQYINTEVRGSTLKIKAEKKLSTSNPIVVRISMPNIDSLDASGAANVVINELKNSGITVDSSGASKIKLSGETAKLTVDVSGATQVNAENLITENATIDASGASHVDVNVTGRLNADASGASKILYTGTPANIEKRSSGASSVSPK